MLKILGMLFTAFGWSFGTVYAQTNPAHIVIIGSVSDVKINSGTTKNPGAVPVNNRMGSVAVFGSGFKARFLSGSTWQDAESSPPSSGSIQFPLGFVNASGSDAPQRSGFAFACLQLALLAKDKGKRFMYGTRPQCRLVDPGPGTWQWQWNTFDTNVANNGTFTQTQNYQVIGAEHYSNPMGFRTSYSHVGDFCAYEFDSSTYKWLAISSNGISIFSTTSAGDPTPLASSDCGSGAGMDTKHTYNIYPGTVTIYIETNVSAPLSGSGPWDYYYSNSGTYILSGRMSPAMWGCFNLIYERLKTGAAFTGGAGSCVLIP